MDTETNVTLDELIEAMERELDRAPQLVDEGEALHFKMSSWVDLEAGNYNPPDQEPTTCNTAACIAGTAWILHRVKNRLPLFEFEHNEEYIGQGKYRGYWHVAGNPDEEARTIGSAVLGIDDNDSMAFFSESNWPWAWLERQELPEVAHHNGRAQELAQGILLLRKLREGHLVLEYDTFDSYRWCIDGIWYRGYTTIGAELPSPDDNEDDDDWESDDDDAEDEATVD